MPSVKTPFGTFDYDPNSNILTCRIKQGQTVDVEEITTMIKAVEGLVGPRPHYALVDFGANLQSTQEARKIYADSAYLHAYRMADAFMVRSLAVRLVANFFINVTKPKVRTKLFTDEEKAMAWLQKMQQKDGNKF